MALARHRRGVGRFRGSAHHEAPWRSQRLDATGRDAVTDHPRSATTDHRRTVDSRVAL